MTEQAIKEIFKKHAKDNFIIYTNIAAGHGINGVSFNKYNGYYRYEDSGYNPKWYEIITKFVNVENGVVRLDYDRKGNYDTFKNGKRTIYLDVNSVLSIEIVGEGFPKEYYR